MDTTDTMRTRRIAKGSSVGMWKAVTVSSDRLKIAIAPRECMDTDSNCMWWANHPRGECDNNPDFMLSKCPVACGVCESRGLGGENYVPVMLPFDQERIKDEL